MLSLLNSFDDSLRTFFRQLTDSLGFLGFLGIFLGVELLFIAIFVVKSIFSYEARLKRSLHKANTWLFKNKKIDENNIAEFNALIKKGPKRLVYYWQQYILYREGTPANYLTEENVIEKPLKTSSWQSNIKTLGMLTCLWSFIAVVFGLASQATETLSLQAIAVGLIFAVIVAVVGAVAIILLKGQRVLNLDDIYHLYHLFSRFLTNACADLTPYIDFDLLFTAKEIENGNPQLREYYEARARKAKEEFENAKNNDVKPTEFQFENVGVDGSLLLNRAMKESESYINKRNATLSQISQVEAQKDALRRNYENVQMDLQRKIQASKENIQKLIEQQAATTSRMEVGLLRQQQEKEVAKQDSLQKDYDSEEKRYLSAKGELDSDIERLTKVLDRGLDEATKGMNSEYQSFLKKVMKSAYTVAEKKVIDEKSELEKTVEKVENELINVQTQIKRMKDENDTLRTLLEEKDSSAIAKDSHYQDGKYIYEDGSYHDSEGLFHDSEGKIFNMNGEQVSQEESQEEIEAREKQEIIDEQLNQFGGVFTDELLEETPTEETVNTLEKEVKASEVKEDKKPAQEVTDEFAFMFENYDNTQNVDVTQTKRRGRPKKISEENAVEEPKRRPGRPKKVESELKDDGPKRKPGRPKKVVLENVNEEPKRKPGRPRKEKTAENDLENINNLINEKEEELNNLKSLVDNQLDEVLNSQTQNEVDKEKDAILKAVETLKEQAENARANGGSEEELAKINKRLEDLINELSNFNNN